MVIGVPAQLGGNTLITQAYYRSYYAIVTRRSRHLNLRSYDDPKWRDIKVGLHSVGNDGANSPPAQALGLHDLGNQVVGFTLWGSDEQKDPQGDVIKAVADGTIDAAIVWGPFAGYFAKPFGKQLVVKPAPAESALPSQPFEWDIAAAVRYDDQALQTSLNKSLHRNAKQIAGILKQYGIPFVKLKPMAIEPNVSRSIQ